MVLDPSPPPLVTPLLLDFMSGAPVGVITCNVPSLIRGVLKTMYPLQHTVIQYRSSRGAIAIGSHGRRARGLSHVEHDLVYVWCSRDHVHSATLCNTIQVYSSRIAVGIQEQHARGLSHVQYALVYMRRAEDHLHTATHFDTIQVYSSRHCCWDS